MSLPKNENIMNSPKRVQNYMREGGREEGRKEKEKKKEKNTTILCSAMYIFLS